MKVDQKYVFIETGSNIDIYNNVNITEIAVDLFDFETDSFIKQVNYPERPFLSGQNNIKNGYLYIFGSDVEGFAEIRKYKINPAVYGKWDFIEPQRPRDPKIMPNAECRMANGWFA